MTAATTPRRPLLASPLASPLALLLAAAGAIAAVLLAATPAAAHAGLTGSTPGDGEVVATPPDRVTLTFSERVALADDAIRVLDPHGRTADTGEITDDGSGGTVRHSISLRPDLPDGTYTVAWHVVSADGHPVSGAFTFSIGAPSATTVDLAEQAASGDGGGTVGLLYDTARYAAYGGFLLLTGGGAFLMRCWPAAAARRPAQRVLLTGWLTLTASTLALLMLRGPYTGSGRLADALDLGALGDVVDTKAGTALLARLVLLGAAAAFVAVLCGPYQRTDAPADLTWGLALGGTVVATGIACTWAMAEHASTGPQAGLAMPMDVLHLLAVACWLGGLATLLVLLCTEPGMPPRAVRRYSQLALASVAALAATGLYAAWRQVRTLDALTGTDYGRLLIAKVALVALLLATARASRRHTGHLADAPADTAAGPATDRAADPEPEPEPAPSPSPGPGTDPERARQLAHQRAAVLATRRRKARDADPTRAALRRSVTAETAIAAVVLAVTTALTTTTPARTADADPPPAADAAPAAPEALPYDTGGASGRGTAQVDLVPGRTGENRLHIRLLDPRGRPADAVELRVALTLPAEGIGPLRHENPARVDAGHWVLTDVRLPRPGDWRLDLTIRTSDIDQTTVRTTIAVPAP